MRLNTRERRFVQLVILACTFVGCFGCGSPEDVTPPDAGMCEVPSTANGTFGLAMRFCSGPPYVGKLCATDCAELGPDGTRTPLPVGCWTGAPGTGPIACVADCGSCP